MILNEQKAGRMEVLLQFIDYITQHPLVALLTKKAMLLAYSCAN